ncbi:RDD family protein [Silanimonas sp.]|jgi:uncharacterized RDD family membrane protein YckC|uniref:RDD family protein n=1 Tax=Silanimonas sp. TaxID=1929290 RepID=UPI0037C9CFE9
METAPWYYVNADRQRQGPVPAATIRELAAAGSVEARTLVWRQGMPQWQPLEAMAGELGIVLAATAPSPAPPSPPPAPAPAPRMDSPAQAADTEATRVLRSEPRLADVGAASPLSEPKRVAPASAYPDAAVQQAYAAQVGADPQARTAFAADGHVLYASFLKRVAASIIDGFIVGIIAVVVQTPIALVAGISLGALGDSTGAGSALLQLASQLIGVAIGIAYFGYFYTSEQQASPGKQLVGIKVARPDGERISFARSVGRYFANWLNIFTLGLSYLLPLFTEKRQALHDLICDTVVVDRWAFTDSPERQTEELGGCAIAVLVLWGLMILGIIGATVFFIAALGSGGWN